MDGRGGAASISGALACLGSYRLPCPLVHNGALSTVPSVPRASHAAPQTRADPQGISSLRGAQTEFSELDKEENHSVKTKVVKMFELMDLNKDGKLILAEAETFFKSFKTLTAKAMFNEVRAAPAGSRTRGQHQGQPGLRSLTAGARAADWPTAHARRWMWTGTRRSRSTSGSSSGTM
jgi:hypothetical protein